VDLGALTYSAVATLWVMGLLDDAIREHLDLKRRRGADPAEVERDEREALGPVRRAPEAPPDGETEDDRSGFAYDQEDEDAGWSHDSYEDESATESAVADRTPEFVDDQPAPEPARAQPVEDGLDEGRFAREEPFAGDEPFGDDEPERGEADHETRASTPAPHPAGGETVEYDVEEALGSERPPTPAGDEDVLEETPEFLQDTPDHDRLWFEQRPPKDFDFDG
jgi:hypothetical protein